MTQGAVFDGALFLFVTKLFRCPFPSEPLTIKYRTNGTKAFLESEQWQFGLAAKRPSHR